MEDQSVLIYPMAVLGIRWNPFILQSVISVIVREYVVRMTRMLPMLFEGVGVPADMTAGKRKRRIISTLVFVFPSMIRSNDNNFCITIRMPRCKLLLRSNQPHILTFM